VEVAIQAEDDEVLFDFDFAAELFFGFGGD